MPSDSEDKSRALATAQTSPENADHANLVFLVRDSTLIRRDSARIASALRDAFGADFVIEPGNGDKNRNNRQIRLDEIKKQLEGSGKRMVNVIVFYDINDYAAAVGCLDVDTDTIFVQADSNARRVRIFGVVQENKNTVDAILGYIMFFEMANYEEQPEPGLITS